LDRPIGLSGGSRCLTFTSSSTTSKKAELEKSAGELSGSVKKLGSELKDAYIRLRKAF